MKKFSKILSVLLCVAMLLGLAAVVGAEGEATTATLVTDVNTLAAGDQVVILNTAGTKAMSISSSNGKYRTLTDATVADNKVTVTTAMQILTLESGTGTGTFAFKAGEDGYLSAKLNANELWTLSKTDDQLPEYASWTISQITGEGVATISMVLSADETRYLQYNAGSTRFAAYKATSKQAPVSIYKLDDASSSDEHTHTYNDAPDGAATIVDGVNHSYSYTCTDASCDNVKTVNEAHTFGEDGTCTACGFKYTGISQILAAANGSWTATGVVTFVSGKNVYIQDSTGGICLYCSAAPEGISVGDVVTGTGSFTTFNGLPELQNVASVTKVTDSDLTLTPKATTIGALTTADICTYVKIEGAVISEITVVKGKTYVTIKQGEDEINLYNPVIVDTILTVGDTLNLTVAVGCYNDLQLVNTNSSEIVVVSTPNPGEDEDKPGEGEDKPGEGEDKPGEGEDKPGEGEDKPGEGVDITKPVENPAVDTGYKLGLNQENLSKYLYFAGDMNGYYLATTESFDDAATVYLETVDAGYRLYFKDGEKKVYIDVQPSEDGQHINAVLTETPTCVYTWDSENLTLLTELEGETYYLGTYNNYSTIGPSKIKYISTSFPVHLYTDAPSQTGDVNLSVVVALMAVSALSVTALVAKKKEF